MVVSRALKAEIEVKVVMLFQARYSHHQSTTHQHMGGRGNGDSCPDAAASHTIRTLDPRTNQQAVSHHPTTTTHEL
ncbi:hypothetical protein IFR04_006445 [Cadophora malorum]|uniref:Uncharacterized protein n=1 Tax=Cadophora malorum TaxID=108018 RepID=A0A8H7TIR8_9HELO|nr:hypothetical protein IFR04_006445 [Cadophora malorum]